MDKKTFSLNAVVSLLGGYLYCDFTEMHELAEHVMGRGIFTHELGNEQFVKEIKQTLQKKIHEDKLLEGLTIEF